MEWDSEGVGHLEEASGHDGRSERGSWLYCHPPLIARYPVPLALSLTQLRYSPDAPFPTSWSPDQSQTAHFPLPEGSV